MAAENDRTHRLAQLDHRHVWHPFTPMRQWRNQPPLIIDRAKGEFLIDTEGRRYIDGVSSLWCNVHGHRVPQIDDAIRQQLDKAAHTTLLGLASPPSIELAARLCEIAPGGPSSSLRPQASSLKPQASSLQKVFYSDAGATALEVAFKMAVGYWHHVGKPHKNRFIAMTGAYHGDTTGSMSVGYSRLFHKPFQPMLFETEWFPAPDACRPPGCEPALAKLTNRRDIWPSEHLTMAHNLKSFCTGELSGLLLDHADRIAAVVIEPVMQGAAGMICQPPGFVREVRDLCDAHETLLIADEVATGFGRTGAMFACEHDAVVPDILCLAKGLTGGYLPVAATLCTDQIEQAFCGELDERRTLYHGHTYTGNALGCAAALASLDLFEQTNLLDHINQSARITSGRLDALRDADAFPHIIDVRQRGLMVGIELGQSRETRRPLSFADQTGAQLCLAMRDKGLIVRPLGDVIILMPIPAMPHDSLQRMLDIVVDTLAAHRP